MFIIMYTRDVSRLRVQPAVTSINFVMLCYVGNINYWLTNEIMGM